MPATIARPKKSPLPLKIEATETPAPAPGMDLKGEAAAARETLLRLAADVAQEKPVDADQLRAARIDSGISIDEFSKIVDAFRVRLIAVEKIQNAESLSPEIERVSAEAAALSEEIKNLRDKYYSDLKALSEKHSPLHAREIDLQSEQLSGRQSGLETLRRTADPALKIRRVTLQRAFNEKQNTLRELERKCQFPNPHEHAVSKTDTQREMESKRWDAANAAAEPFRAEVKKLREEIEKLDALILDPMHVNIETILKKK